MSNLYESCTSEYQNRVPTYHLYALRFDLLLAVDGFHWRDFRKLEGLSIDNDNAEDENGATGTDEIFALRYQRACRQASLRYNFTALCQTKRNEMKRNEV